MSTGIRAVRWSLIGLAASLAVVLVIMRLFNVPLTAILEAPRALLFVSVLLCVMRLLAQGFRFYMLVKRHSLVRLGLGEALMVRSVSEFFALTTVPFIADESVRLMILVQRGEKTVTAFWIAFSELILDVAVTAPIAVSSGIMAFVHGDVYLAAVLMVLPLIQLSLTTLLVLLPRLQKTHSLNIANRISIPRRFLEPLKRFSGESNNFLKNFVSSRGRVDTVVLTALTTVVMTLPAVTLYLVYSMTVDVGFVEALLAFHAGNVLGALPVTVGGAGLTEAGTFLFSSRVLRITSIEAVVLWRVLTYYLTLLITGLMFVFYALLSIRRFRNREKP
ncbi:MAG: lysylphosphatidylglycerol synthase domain-containing protein [Candidatus Caldarchaeum sp.]